MFLEVPCIPSPGLGRVDPIQKWGCILPEQWLHFMNISLPPTPLPLPISIVGARPANLDQSRQEGACFWCRAVCGGVQEGARASSRHTVGPMPRFMVCSQGTCVRPGGDPELWSNTTARGVPLPHTHPCASSPEEQRVFGPTVYRAPHPCCTDMGATQRAFVMSSGPCGVWVVSAESLLQDPVWGSCSPHVSHRLHWSRATPGSV